MSNKGASGTSFDAVVVGSGPNGLAAAIRLAQHSLSVLVLEANDSIGGGTRSAELTLPGFTHDLCSAVHPLGIGSPFFRQLPLEQFGLKWLHPELPLAHPLPNDQAVALHRSVASTAQEMGPDNKAYGLLMNPLVAHWESLSAEFMQSLLHLPQHPIQLLRFARRSLRSASGLAGQWFETEPARALLAGLAAHSFLPLEQIPSAAFGVVLGMMGHAVGWPSPRGGSQSLAHALGAYLTSLGGQIRTGNRVRSLGELPKARAVLLDVTTRQLLQIAGAKMPLKYRARLERFRYGPGIFKMDYALDGPIPWKASACSRAGTVHVCGTFQDVSRAEREAAEGKHPERPFVLLAQPSLFDPGRAPSGKHVVWAYCHVPSNSVIDMTQAVENQIERFAPGFRDRILARHTANCSQLEASNANLVNGSISGGVADLWQMIARPTLSLRPWRTAVPGVYLCSSSTPPGGGVHGMCGFHAAETAIQDCFS